MRKPVLTFLVLLVTASVTFAQKQPSREGKAVDRAVTQKVDALFTAWNKPTCPGCALAIIKENRIVYKKGYGIANLEYDLPITPSSVFYVGSIAKQFTAMCVALLAQQGKLALDDDIRKFLPEIPDYGTPITIRHLVRHTSGLQDFWDLLGKEGRRWDDAYEAKDILQMIARQKELNSKPGEKHIYSNSGYFLLGMIVHRASGKSLREFADEQIFKPLGMRNTRFQDDHTAIIKNRVYGYAPQDGDHFSVHVINNDLVGAGGLWTSAEDLSLWDANFYSAKVGGNSVIQQLHTLETLPDETTFDYTFGLHVDAYKGMKRVRHGGVFAGYRAEMLRLPEQQFSVVVLCNLSSIAPANLANQIVDIFFPNQSK